MTLSDYFEVTKFMNKKDYKLAEKGVGFIVPGTDALASISLDEPIQYVALLQYIENEARANHYHRVKLEYVAVLNGKLGCILHLPDEPDNKIERILEAGSMIKIRPGCVHIFTALNGNATALELSPQKLDLSDQIHI